MYVQVVSVPYRYDVRDKGLGAGPIALLDNGLVDALAANGITISGQSVAELSEDARADGSIAVNIGRLGASTAGLVANGRSGSIRSLVLCGDDTGVIGVVAGLQQAHGPAARIGIVWLDAHGDFNTPEISVSGILAGMPLAIVAGLAGPNWRDAAGMMAPIPTDRILLAGVRELDEKEEMLLRSTSVRLLTTADLRKSGAFEQAVRSLASRCDLILLHFDLDLLDPSVAPSLSTPSAGGLDLEEAATALSTALSTGKVEAMVVCNLNPGGGKRGQQSVENTIRILARASKHWT